MVGRISRFKNSLSWFLVFLQSFYLAFPPLFLLLAYDPEAALYTRLSLYTWMVINFTFGLIVTFAFCWAQRFKILLCLGLLILFLDTINILYAVSIYIQGAGFNDLFFRHFHVQTLLVSEHFIFLFVLAALSVICCLLQLFFTRKIVISRFSFSARYASFSTLLAVVLAGLSPPSYDLLYHLAYGQSFSTSDFYRQVQAEKLFNEEPLKTHFEQDPKFKLGRGKKPMNVIWIYLESFEKSYFDDARYAPFLKDLIAIKERSVNFTNVKQLRHINSTGMGIFSSQCAFPYHLSPQEPVCFMRALVQRGYTTAHLQSANTGFNDFILKKTGYQHFLGKHDIQPSVSSQQRNKIWGIFDEGFFDFVRAYYQKIYTNHKPFAMTLLTVDNHVPVPALGTNRYNNNISPICRTFENFSKHKRFTQAAWCTSWTVAHLIQDIRAHPDSKNTLIVVMSDHLHPHHNFSVSSNRRLTFFINFPDGHHDEIHAPGTHFDIAPTVLEAMGFEETDMKLGHSLLSHSAGFLDTVTVDRPAKMHLATHALFTPPEGER